MAGLWDIYFQLRERIHVQNAAGSSSIYPLDDSWYAVDDAAPPDILGWSTTWSSE